MGTKNIMDLLSIFLCNAAFENKEVEVETTDADAFFSGYMHTAQYFLSETGHSLKETIKLVPDLNESSTIK